MAQTPNNNSEGNVKQKILESMRHFHLDRSIEIKHLPIDVTESEILEMLSDISVKGVEIIRGSIGMSKALVNTEDFSTLDQFRYVYKFLRQYAVPLKLTETKNLLCVAKLPLELTEPQFQDLVSCLGEVCYSFLMFSEKTEKSKGYGFVKYKHEVEPDRMLHIHPSLICDWVKSDLTNFQSLNSKCLYVNNVPKSVSIVEYRQIFSKVAKPIFFQVPLFMNGSCLNWGLVEYEDWKDAEATHSLLNTRKMKGHGFSVDYCIPGMHASTLVHEQMNKPMKIPFLLPKPTEKAIAEIMTKLYSKNPVFAISLQCVIAREVEAASNSPVATVPNSPLATMPNLPVAIGPNSPVAIVPNSPLATIPNLPVAIGPHSPVAIVPNSPLETMPNLIVAIGPHSPVATVPMMCESPRGMTPDASLYNPQPQASQNLHSSEPKITHLFEATPFQSMNTIPNTLSMVLPHFQHKVFPPQMNSLSFTNQFSTLSAEMKHAYPLVPPQHATGFSQLLHKRHNPSIDRPSDASVLIPTKFFSKNAPPQLSSLSDSNAPQQLSSPFDAKPTSWIDLVQACTTQACPSVTRPQVQPNNTLPSLQQHASIPTTHASIPTTDRFHPYNNTLSSLQQHASIPTTTCFHPHNNMLPSLQQYASIPTTDASIPTTTPFHPYNITLPSLQQHASIPTTTRFYPYNNMLPSLQQHASMPTTHTSIPTTHASIPTTTRFHPSNNTLPSLQQHASIPTTHASIPTTTRFHPYNTRFHPSNNTIPSLQQHASIPTTTRFHPYNTR